MKLQEMRFPAEKSNLSYAYLHHEITKDAKPNNNSLENKEKRRIVWIPTVDDDLIKYKSGLPSYLHNRAGENVKDRAFHVGVVDWGRLEKWHHTTTSSSASSPFSTEGSPSSRGRSFSPIRIPRGARNTTLETERCSVASKSIIGALKPSEANDAKSKESSTEKARRSSSPLRRLISTGLGGNFVKSSISKEHSTDKANPASASKSRSSPLRRLLDPIMKQKPSNRSPPAVHALLRVSFKNGFPLFTFAVDNDGDVLEAMAKNCCVYTFSTIRKVKKRTAIAQMSISDTEKFRLLREFVLFSVDTNYRRGDELAAIVFQGSVKDRGGFNMTVILPGGVHSLPSKGEPYSLIRRWKSGGSCDCGGWDQGCRFKVLSGSEASSGSDRFSLFPQRGDVEKPVLVLTPVKDSVFSVEFGPALSMLQAFSVGIAVLDSWKVVQCHV